MTTLVVAGIDQFSQFLVTSGEERGGILVGNFEQWIPWRTRPKSRYKEPIMSFLLLNNKNKSLHVPR